MKIALVLFLITFTSTDADIYTKALQSPPALQNLYNTYVSTYHPGFARAENTFRFRLFQKELKKVISANNRFTWSSGINMFSAMTAVEKRSYLGLNMTNVLPSNSVDSPTPNVAGPPLSAGGGKDWRLAGKVTGVKNQGACGSCWAFSAVGVLETTYAIMTNRRKQFSEQEYVDCAYDASYDKDTAVGDSCDIGGFYTKAWKYSKESKRLAIQDNAPYNAKDGACNYYGKVPDGLLAAKISGYKKVPTEAKIIRTLNSQPVAVGYEVTEDFNRYTGGVISDDTCAGDINHAVTAVGYTRDAMILKNSWGAWGEGGYFRTARYHHGCQIYRYAYYVTLTYTRRPDTDPEYVPTDDANCDGTNADGCACGTVRCGDGICRHPHMC